MFRKLIFLSISFFSEFKELDSKNKSFLKEFIELDKDGDGFVTIEDMKQCALKRIENLDEKEISMILLMDDEVKISFTGTFF